MGKKDKQKQENTWGKRQKSKTEKIIKGKTSEWLKKGVKGPSVAAAEGHLAYQGWCVISLPAELKWATLSGMGKTKQGLREADRKRGKDGKTERRESISFSMYTEYVAFATEEVSLSHYVICWGNSTSLRPYFSRPSQRHLVTHYRPWFSLCKCVCVVHQPRWGSPSRSKAHLNYTAFRDHALLPKLLICKVTNIVMVSLLGWSWLISHYLLAKLELPTRGQGKTKGVSQTRFPPDQERVKSPISLIRSACQMVKQLRKPPKPTLFQCLNC